MHENKYMNYCSAPIEMHLSSDLPGFSTKIPEKQKIVNTHAGMHLPAQDTTVGYQRPVRT